MGRVIRGNQPANPALQAYEVVSDREERDDEIEAEKAKRVIEVAQPGVYAEERWVKKGGNSVLVISSVGG